MRIKPNFKSTLFILLLLTGSSAHAEFLDRPLDEMDALFQTGPDEIVGGVKVKKSDSIEKSVVALYQDEGKAGTLCSATLIAKDMALTAAHCVEKGTEGMVLLFGTDIRKDSKDAITVTQVEIPQSWGERQDEDTDLGDIAVIRFEGGLPSGFKPATLAPKGLTLSVGETVTIAGYGITDAASQSGAGVLRKTEVKVVNPNLGKTEMVLDQESGSGACHGDSGGPAFSENNGKTYLIGVTNRSYPDQAPDDCKHQVVYTKTAPYRSWIAKSEKSLRGAR